jgi:hypothetical protein
MHLNGWQRIGIVASICWIVIGGLWIRGNVFDDLAAPATAVYRNCISKPEYIIEDCDRKYDAAWRPIADHWDRIWYYTAAYTLIPIPIVWLIVYGLVGLVRWIKAGFAPRPR